MKFNWGTGIFAFYGLFMIAMLTAVFASGNYKPNLVQKDYYALDINYQQRLDAKNRAFSLSVKPVARFENGFLIIEMPQEALPQSGSILIYRGSNDQPDVVRPVVAAPVQRVAMPDDVASGKWHVDLLWNSDGADYYVETSVVVP
jgi:hypothetical protein